MRKILILTACGLLSACSSALAPGDNKAICETTPEACMTARQAMKESSGTVVPTPSQAALQRGDSMRVWVAPMRTPSGVLTNSGHLYLD